IVAVALAERGDALLPLPVLAEGPGQVLAENRIPLHRALYRRELVIVRLSSGDNPAARRARPSALFAGQREAPRREPFIPFEAEQEIADHKEENDAEQDHRLHRRGEEGDGDTDHAPADVEHAGP